MRLLARMITVIALSGAAGAQTPIPTWIEELRFAPWAAGEPAAANRPERIRSAQDAVRGAVLRGDWVAVAAQLRPLGADRPAVLWRLLRQAHHDGVALGVADLVSWVELLPGAAPLDDAGWWRLRGLVAQWSVAGAAPGLQARLRALHPRTGASAAQQRIRGAWLAAWARCPDLVPEFLAGLSPQAIPSSSDRLLGALALAATQDLIGPEAGADHALDRWLEGLTWSEVDESLVAEAAQLLLRAEFEPDVCVAAAESDPRLLAEVLDALGRGIEASSGADHHRSLLPALLRSEAIRKPGMARSLSSVAQACLRAAQRDGGHRAVAPEILSHLARADARRLVEHVLAQYGRTDHWTLAEPWLRRVFVRDPEHLSSALDAFAEAFVAHRIAQLGAHDQPGFAARGLRLENALRRIEMACSAFQADGEPAALPAFRVGYAAVLGHPATWTVATLERLRKADAAAEAWFDLLFRRLAGMLARQIDSLPAEICGPALDPAFELLELLAAEARLAPAATRRLNTLREISSYLWSAREMAGFSPQDRAWQFLAAEYEDLGVEVGTLDAILIDLTAEVLGSPGATLPIGSQPVAGAELTARAKPVFERAVAAGTAQFELRLDRWIDALPPELRGHALRRAGALLGDRLARVSRLTERLALHRLLDAQLGLGRRVTRIANSPRQAFLVTLELLGSSQIRSLVQWPDRRAIELGLYRPELGAFEVHSLTVFEPQAAMGRDRVAVASFILELDQEGAEQLPPFDLALEVHDGVSSFILERHIEARALAAVAPATDPEQLQVSLTLDTSPLPASDTAFLLVTATGVGGVPDLEVLLQEAERSGGDFGTPEHLGYTQLAQLDGGAHRWTRGWRWPLTRKNGDDLARTFSFPSVQVPEAQVRYLVRDARGLRKVASTERVVLSTGEGLSPLNRLILFGSAFLTMLLLMVIVILMGNRARARKLRADAA